MANVTQEEVKRIAHRYEQIRKTLHSLTGGSDSSQTELLRIIHNPGWTTVLDVELAAFSLDAMEQQVKAIEKLHEALTAGARNGLQKSAAA